jgi:thymidylate synthase ThyX
VKRTDELSATFVDTEALQLGVAREQESLYKAYEAMLGAGVPKEVARINTPVSRYSVMRWKANLRNWLQMLKLRDHGAAQWECQQYAKAVGQIIAALWPRTYALWEEHTKYAVTLSRSEVNEMKDLLRGGKRMPRESRSHEVPPEELLSQGLLEKFK